MKSVQKIYNTYVSFVKYWMYPASISGFPFGSENHHFIDQEALPGPPNPPALDSTMTDLELFRAHCMDLGDQWPEAG